MNSIEAFVTSDGLRLWTERFGEPDDPAVRVLTLTAIMTGPMGHDAGPAWARALGGQAPDPGDLPPPSPRFLAHLGRLAGSPRTTRRDVVAADLETWRVLNGDVLPFDERAARRFVEDSYERASDYAAAAQHDPGHGFFSPGLPRRVAGLVLEHTG